MHECVAEPEVRRWAVTELAQTWIEEGLEVLVARGPKGAEPADLLFLHVDLSVVPDEYLAVADRYPAVVNGRIKDIRKSTCSTNLVRPGDGWDGACIVKSNLNCAGGPERLAASRGFPLETPLPSFPFPMRSQMDYRLYEQAAMVPAEYFHDPNLVVERFLPEQEGGMYFTRSYHFLGSAGTAVRLGGPLPIVIGSSQKMIEQIEPPAELLEFRKQLGLDYGKIDYLIHDGKPVVVDVNKTTGHGGVSTDPGVQAMRRARARGIWDFLR